MLKRKIKQRHIDWKKTENHKPLINKGCRHKKGMFLSIIYPEKNLLTDLPE